MKHTLFKSLFFTSLLLLAAACGKDGGGGGGSSSNPLTGGGGLTGNSSTYYQELSNWYKAAEVKSVRNYSKVSRQLSTSSNSTSCPGEIKEYLGFIKVCVYSGSSSNPSTDGSMVTYNVAFEQGTTINYNNPIYCDVSNCIKQTYAGKASNTKLQAALKANAGLYLYSVTKLSSTLYQLTYTNSQLDATPRIVYKIDTSLHSIYNPVEVVDLNSLTQEYVILR